MVGHINQLIADSRPGCAQLLQASDDTVVAGAAHAADYRDGGARTGEHLSKRQPGGAGATADQHDIVSTEREVAKAEPGQQVHHGLSHGAVAVDGQLAVLSGTRARDAPCGGQTRRRQRGPDRRDADARMLGVQRRPQPGQSRSLADRDKLASADRVLDGLHRGQACPGVVQGTEHDEGTPGFRVMGEKITNLLVQRTAAAGVQPPRPVIRGRDKKSRLLGSFRIAPDPRCHAVPRPDCGGIAGIDAVGSSRAALFRRCRPGGEA